MRESSTGERSARLFERIVGGLREGDSRKCKDSAVVRSGRRNFAAYVYVGFYFPDYSARIRRYRLV